MLRRIITYTLALALLLAAGTAAADSTVSMHYVFLDWVGTYTGQVDSNSIPFGFGLFVSDDPMDNELWHYLGSWEDGLPEGEGSIYFEDGSMRKGTFSRGVLTEGFQYSVSGLAVTPIKTERSLTETEAVYIGNKKSMRFHVPTCRSVTQMKESNKVEFFSREEAVEAHYIPCGDCNP